MAQAPRSVESGLRRVAAVHDPSNSEPAAVVAELAATRAWLEGAVIGLNLCPFAKAVHAKGQIRWVLADESEPEALLHRLADECALLVRSDAELIDTTLIVAPHAPAAFAAFNRLLGVAEALMADMQLDGVLQLAAFHPQWRFAGSRADDLANASNRSPLPTLHLLREASVERGVDAVPDAHDIWGRNVQTLNGLGAAGWQALASGWNSTESRNLDEAIKPRRAARAQPGPPPAPASSARSARPTTATPPAAPAAAPASARRNRGR
jgi:uncharacterized protein